MNKENKLGMGLGALLSTNSNKNETNNSIQKINISQIMPNPSQPRKNFKDEELKELSSSIKNQGLIQPIIIKPIKDDQYQIIAGERRWRACQLNGMHEVECVIKNLEDTNVLEAALIENIQREDLNVIEEARGYQRLVKEFGYDHEKISKFMAKSRSHISNTLRLLSLPQDIIGLIEEGKLTAGQARPLIGMPNASEVAENIVKKKVAARQVEALAKQIKSKISEKIRKFGKILANC